MEAEPPPPPIYVVDADYHQINLFDGTGPGPDMIEGDAGPLLAVGPNWLIIQTGVAMGWVRVTVSMDKPPALGTTPAPEWEMTEETSIAVDTELWLTSFSIETRYQLTSSLTPGYARIRVSCRGRALNYDAYVWTDGPENPKEDYLVEIWQEEAPRQTVVVGDDEPWSIVSRPREEPADPGQSQP